MGQAFYKIIEHYGDQYEHLKDFDKIIPLSISASAL